MFLAHIQEAAEQKQVTEAKKKTEMASAAAAIKTAILSDAATAASKPAEVVVDAATPAPSTATLMKESVGTLRKATVTSAGDLKEELVDRAPVLIDKAEVMQVIRLVLGRFAFAVCSFFFAFSSDEARSALGGVTGPGRKPVAYCTSQKNF